MSVIDDLKKHEGFRTYPYQDIVGIWTFGYGFTSITQEEAEAILKMRVDNIRKALSQYIQSLDQVRQDVIINMAFNLGLLGLMGFKQMWAAVYRKDFDTAADEMLSSRWARQVGNRAIELAERMRTGVIIGE